MHRYLKRLRVKTLVWLNTLDDDRFVKFSAATSQQNRVTQEQHYGASSTLGFVPQVDGLAHLQLELGASIEKQDNESRRYLAKERVITSQTRDQHYDLSVAGVYAQLSVEPVSWLRFTPSWRLDKVDGDFQDFRAKTTADINDYGTISQPKLALAILASDDVTFFSNWGRSFQIGAGSGAYLIPPRLVDLAPSVNDGWELGGEVPDIYPHSVGYYFVAANCDPVNLNANSMIRLAILIISAPPGVRALMCNFQWRRCRS